MKNGTEWPQTYKFSHHKGKNIRPTVKKCSRVVLVKNTLQLVMKNREKTFSPIIQNSRLSNMHPWHSPANWYGPVQNSTQHHELWETWEGACSEKLEETQTIFLASNWCIPSPEVRTALWAVGNLGRRVGALCKVITLCYEIKYLTIKQSFG